MSYLLNNFRRHGGELNSHDLLKFIAIILMIADHTGMFFLEDNNSLRLLGRLSFPIFFFLIGYSNNFSNKKDIFIIAGLMLINDLWVNWPIFPLNILFGVIFCRWILEWLGRKNYLEKYPAPVLAILTLLSFPAIFIFEYGAEAVIFAILGILTRLKPGHKQPIFPYLLAAILYCFYQIMGFAFSVFNSTILAIMISLLCFLFHEYRFRKFSTLPCVISYPIMFLARNSLIIYALHIIIFQWLFRLKL